MRLIGAGLPRTATLTQKVALEMLGVGPTYHMVDVLQDMPRLRQWQAALDGDADWDAIFDGYNSTVDWPGSFFYRELAARACIDPLWRDYQPTMQRMWRETDMMEQSTAFDADALARQMERYNAQVQAEFPDVLVWSPADGWEPICELLELPVPDEPFPHVNDSASFESMFVHSSLQAINEWQGQQTPVAGH
jgi:hypothetical protein